MTEVKVNRSKDYVVMSNNHFKEKNMSLKAKGLLSLMLSLPESWDYSIKGLTSISKESFNTIKSILKELKKYGYLEIVKINTDKAKNGRYEYEYNVYEEPKNKRPKNNLLFFDTNNNIYNTNIVSDNNIVNDTNIGNNIINNNRKAFKKPTLEEIKEYCQKRNNGVDAKKFYDYYEANDWIDQTGKKVKSWKQKIITWEGSRGKKQEVVSTKPQRRIL